MQKGREITRGKTKILFEADKQPDLAVVQQMDAITAGDGARRNEIEGKGRIAAKTTARIFRLLNLCGVPTHYISGGEDDDNNEMLVRRAQMIPLEVVIRGIAAGSFVKRRPGIGRGTILVPRIVEFFFKDDANHDPLIEPEAILAQSIATPQELGVMSELARIVYEILSHAWRRHDTLLVDLKIEFGRLASGEGKGQLVVADVVDNDAWRVWPQGREELMLDKQLYRNLPEVKPEDLATIRANYERVAEIVGTFPLMRPGMVAVIADGPEFVERSGEIARALGNFGLPTVRHVASATRTPGYVLQLVAQIDATFARAIMVTVGSGDGALATMIEYASATPVIRAPATADVNLVALQCAKAFSLEDTVVFGRVLLVEANARSTVLQADASLNQPAPPASA
ncbi:MAG TPA: phosphoribosylaminoimidazolesuccinocarboxamide synthase [Candidatus Lustribacter sp.]|nr:phosphoribosylaminoimidazolesuccinocarboxamide synthase [Candidatus Lustribacter sp.]